MESGKKAIRLFHAFPRQSFRVKIVFRETDVLNRDRYLNDEEEEIPKHRMPRADMSFVQLADKLTLEADEGLVTLRISRKVLTVN